MQSHNCNHHRSKLISKWNIIFCNRFINELFTHVTPISWSLYKMVKHLLLWAQCNLCSLRAVHMLGRLIQGADMLFLGSVSPGELRLHPQVVQVIWNGFRRAEEDFFTSEDSCPTIFSKEQMVWLMIGPVLACMPSLWFLCSHRSSGESGRSDARPPGGPTLVEPDVVPRVDTGVVEPSFLSLRWEFLPLPMRVN